MPRLAAHGIVTNVVVHETAAGHDDGCSTISSPGTFQEVGGGRDAPGLQHLAQRFRYSQLQGSRFPGDEVVYLNGLPFSQMKSNF